MPVALGIFLGVYNRVTGEPLPLLYTGCLLLGFLSYKGALITKLVADLSPKVGCGFGWPRQGLGWLRRVFGWPGRGCDYQGA